MTNFIKGEYLDGDEGVVVVEVTDDFLTVSSFNFLAASWLQWLRNNDWYFLNTWRSPEGPIINRSMTVTTNFKREKP